MGVANQRTQELAKVLHALFNGLRECAAEYCVLRNYEELPDYTTHDVDILVSEASLEAAIAATREACDACDWTILAEVAQSGCHSIYLFWDESESAQLLTVDFITQVLWGWFPTADVAQIMRARREHRGIPIAARGHDAAIRVMKVGLGRQAYSEKAIDFLSSLGTDDLSLLRELLADILTSELTDTVLNCIEEHNFDGIALLRKNIQRSVFRHAYLRAPIQTNIRMMSYSVHRAFRLIKRSLGVFVVLIGPDGAGKTTLSSGLEERLGTLMFRGCKVYHTDFNLLPRLRSILRRVSGLELKDIDFTARHSGSSVEPHSVMRASIYLMYYTLGFLAGHFVLRLRAGRGEMILMDRYFYNYYYQRYYSDVPWWLLEWFRLFVPTPDVVLILGASPEVIYKRKPELDMDEIHRQLTALDRLRPLLKGSVVTSVETHSGERFALALAEKTILRSVAMRNLTKVGESNLS